MGAVLAQPQLIDLYYKEKSNGEYIYTNRNFTFLHSSLDSSIKYIYDYFNGSLVPSELIYSKDPVDTSTTENYFYDPNSDTWLYNDSGDGETPITINNNEVDPGNQNNSGGGSSSGSSSRGSGESCVFSKILAVNTNIKNTHISISYTRKNGTSVSINNIISIINENIVVTIDSEFQGGEVVSYTATTYQYNEERDDLEVFQTLEGTITIQENCSGNIIKLRFQGTPRSKYYFKINNSEEKWVTTNTDTRAKTIEVNITTNIEDPYKIRIYSNDNYGTFKVNGVDIIDKSVINNCPQNLTLSITLTELNYNPSITEFGPREPEVYSINAYSYNRGGFPNESKYMRKIEFYCDIPSKYYNDLGSSREYILYQKCDFALPENQTAELDISDKNRYGHLNPAGGSMKFKIKAKCYWYIHSLVPDGFGIPNTCTFSPSEGGPNEWIEVTMSWPEYTGYARRDREINIKSIFTDQVICEKHYSGVGYYSFIKSQPPVNLINNPSGRIPTDDFAAILPLYSLIIYGQPRYLSNDPRYKKWTFTKEVGEVDVYFNPFIKYTIQPHESWLHHSVKSAKDGEFNPGPKVYTLRVDENNTGVERSCTFVVEVDDPRFSGNDYITIIQKPTTSEESPSGYIKEQATILINSNSTLDLTVTASDKWFIGSSTTTYGERCTPYEPGVDHRNPHPATDTSVSLRQEDMDTVWVGLFVFSQELYNKRLSVWYLLTKTVFYTSIYVNNIQQRYIIGGE